MFYFYPMQAFNFNGKIYPSGTAIVGPENRGLRYGDGIFETLRFKDDQLILADEHFARLWKGLNALGFTVPKLLSPELLEAQTRQLLEKNKISSARVRINMFRGDGGLYDPETQHPNYIIETWPLNIQHATLQENGLQICLYRECEKAPGKFSNLKHNNYLPYLMGAMHAKTSRCNDALIFNSNHRICDSTIANVFIIKNNKIITPPLEEGCVAGVMRAQVIQQLKSANPVHEIPITETDLLDADEIFLTNAIYRIRWVAGCEGKIFHCQQTRALFEQLQQTNPAVFC